MEANGGCVEIEDEGLAQYPVFDDSDSRRLQRSANDLVRETTEVRKWDPPSGTNLISSAMGLRCACEL